MFLIIGLLILGALGTVCLGCLVAASQAATSKRKGAALLWASPVMLIGGLFVAGIMWGAYATEAYPEETFTKIFKVEPTAQITKMRVYSDGDELTPVFLQFHAPPALAQSLLNSKFSPTSNASAIGAMAMAERVEIPRWFDKTVAPDAQVFQLNSDFSSPSYIAIYDSKLNRVRDLLQRSFSAFSPLTHARRAI